MQYIDSGSRHAQQALGTWLGQELLGQVPPSELRLQSGFFGSASLGFFEAALAALENADGQTSIIVGSNDGMTPRAAVADLIALAGQPRSGLRLGVVSFQTGLFHPKVYHFSRPDGSSTAYVGSANLTLPGVNSSHVEAGLILDSRAGDSPSVLAQIADAIDEWFVSARPGLYGVSVDADLDPLVQARILDVTPPPRPRRAVRPARRSPSSGSTQTGQVLHALVAAPPIQATLPSSSAGTGSYPGGGTAAQAVNNPSPLASPSNTTPPSKIAAVKHWGKKLSDSDAQRKKTGNQRGAITLVQGDYRHQIDQTTYFRSDLFGGQTWVPGVASTGQPLEKATVPMKVTINGVFHGVMDFLITNGTSRESAQNNYTAELHIEPIGQLIRQTNISGQHLDIALDANGDYWLTIS
ncbi:NgoFVII family restriction endonuclease [Propionibacterium freudenreichii]|uniref:phospholipase D family protein n=1 Tax=Propionibacterium freudenreichii TaxID=1744 RepID=UPI00254B5814|nr:phospholipase D family protein [Propionibacterium freudenreichii]MDK9659336.1 NgoFVII family restriction endonuclease [Propionibacterium freudenreichii]